MWIHWPFFAKIWTKGHWPLDDLWPHVCWGHMCDSTQGSLCPSPMTIHQCVWIQWSILQNTTHTHTTYRMSDHIVSYWTQFRRDKKRKKKKKKTKKLAQNVENHFIAKTLKSLKNCTNLLFSIRFLSYTLLGCRCISPIWSSLDPNRRFLPHLCRAIRRFLLRWVDPRRSIQFWLP